MQYMIFVSLFDQDSILCFPASTACKLKSSVNGHIRPGNSIIII